MSKHDEFNSTVLQTADELTKSSSSSKIAFPRGGGEKCYKPSGTWQEEKELDSLLQERIDLLQEDRLIKRNDLSHGEWKPDVRFVVLTKGKGKLFQRMGFHKNGEHLLYPVEALFLMESSVLQVTYNGCPISIEQGYTLLLTDFVEKYQVYSHLARLGYTVIIHQKAEKITLYEKKIRLDRHIEPKLETNHDPHLLLTRTEDVTSEFKRNASEVELSQNVTNNEKVLPADLNPSTKFQDVSSSSSEKSFLSFDSDKNRTGFFSCDSDNRQSKNDNRIEREDCNANVFPFPSFLPNKKMIIKSPPSHLLPKNVTPSRSLYVLCPHRFEQRPTKKTNFDYRGQTSNPHWARETHDRRQRFGEKRSSDFKQKYRPMQNDTQSSYFSKQRSNEQQRNLEEYPCAIPKLQLKVNNWKEFKSAAVSSLSSAGWPLFVDRIQPLVTKTVSTDELHSKIKVVKEIDFSALVDQVTQLDAQSDYKIDFDVYLPHLSYKKSQPSCPSLRLSVINSQQPVPSIAEIASLHVDQVPFYFAVVDHGEINFYGLQAVSLCPVKPMTLL